MKNLITDRDLLAKTLENTRANRKIVFTNGCFDILHVGHVELLEKARNLGDFLVVGVNSDASVKRLKGESRPIHDQNARAQVLAALKSVDAVVIFEENTPIETIAVLRPDIHVKGGDYKPDDLPEAATVRENGGEIAIISLVEGFSSSRAIEQLKMAPPKRAVIVIPARFGSTRFPGKPLVELGGQTVISRVVRAALQTTAEKPVLVATDDARIREEIESHFDESDAVPVMTSSECHTGTDRLAEAVRTRFGDDLENLIVVNVQGDEPFIEPQHINILIELMRRDRQLNMATLAAPVTEKSLESDPNVVKVAVSEQGRALYFSRSPIPFDRDGNGATYLRHLGIYAYDAHWLLKMASLPPAKLEEIEKLEQLRALENGVSIGVEIVDNVVPIAIDTPADLERAEKYLRSSL
jgi:3-deoxy-manno-octulosonate cytidylyltransferase (CMP-KDO synthetase)